eukprot:6044028-Prorocentrum_lima.AAC.1
MEKEKTGSMQDDDDDIPDVAGLAKLAHACQVAWGKDHDKTKQAQEDLAKAKASRDKSKPQVKRLQEATEAVKRSKQSVEVAQSKVAKLKEQLAAAEERAAEATKKEQEALAHLEAVKEEITAGVGIEEEAGKLPPSFYEDPGAKAALDGLKKARLQVQELMGKFLAGAAQAPGP